MTPAHRRLAAGMIDTAAGPVEYARCGRGPAVVLVHGLPGSWRQLAPLALDLADEHTVVLPSRPGYGRTPATTGHTPFQQAGAHAALLDAIGIGEASIVGVSGGGPSAAAFAQRYPERTPALALCCPLAPHLMEQPAALRVALAVPGLAAVGTRVRRRRERRGIADHVATDRRIARELTPAEQDELRRRPALRDELVGFFLSHLDGPTPVRGLRNDVASMGFARHGSADPPPLDRVEAATVVLHGDADAVVPLAHARFYAGAIRGARLEVLAGAGHAFLLTFRERSLQVLRAALAPVTPR